MLAEQLDLFLPTEAVRPVVVALDAQEIAAMYVRHVTPDEFNQYLMQKFKAAGAPVEGQLRLTFAHGQMARVKHPPVGIFLYVWLSDGMASVLLAAQQANGLLVEPS